jgi:hypothetical protein
MDDHGINTRFCLSAYYHQITMEWQTNRIAQFWNFFKDFELIGFFTGLKQAVIDGSFS